jgi:hypothetical protein
MHSYEKLPPADWGVSTNCNVVLLVRCICDAVVA